MRLGVDFGTTTTAIAIVDRGNYPIVSFVNNHDDTVDFVPSIIALDGDRLVYGFDAEDAAREGAPHLRSFKRLLSDPSVTDTSTLRLGNHSISILDALTGFLGYVCASCAQILPSLRCRIQSRSRPSSASRRTHGPRSAS